MRGGWYLLGFLCLLLSSNYTQTCSNRFKSVSSTIINLDLPLQRSHEICLDIHEAEPHLRVISCSWLLFSFPLTIEYFFSLNPYSFPLPRLWYVWSWRIEPHTKFHIGEFEKSVTIQIYVPTSHLYFIRVLYYAILFAVS